MSRVIPTRATHPVTLALALMATSCDSAPANEAVPDAGTAQTPIRDSADILIVDNARPAADSRLGWQVSPDPLLSIGTVGGTDDFQLHHVDDALRLRDGRIVVANAGSHRLLVFDDEGKYLASWGQRGQGPGDFSGLRGSNGLGPAQLFWMERWAGDSLAVCHSGSAKGAMQFVSIWDTHGNFGRRLNLGGGADVPTCRDVLPGGDILALNETPRATDVEKGMSRQAGLELFVVAGDGSRRGSLGTFPGAETFWHWENYPWDGTQFFIPDPPFQKSLVWAVWGELVIVAPTDHYELRAYSPDGSLARLVRREHDVRSPTEADLDNYRTDRLRMVADRPPELTRIFSAALDAIPLPESFPAISAIEVDLLGNLWVREYNLPEDGDRALWTVFDPEGVVMGFVETPPGLVIYEIGEDYILGKMEDELRVEYVRLWGLDRKSTPSLPSRSWTRLGRTLHIARPEFPVPWLGHAGVRSARVADGNQRRVAG